MRLAGYLCNPSANEYTLERLSAEYSVTAPDISGDADDALKSAVLFMAVADKLTSVLKESGEYKLLLDIEIPLAKVLASMENEGFLVDKDGLLAYGKELEERITVIQKQIFEITGYEFNLNSPKTAWRSAVC